MRRLAIAALLLLAGCGTSVQGLQSPTLFSDLAKDPNTAVLCVPAVPPYFSGLFFARQNPQGTQLAKCGDASIGPSGANGLTAVPPGGTLTITVPAAK